jgi:hypothetical protein
VRAFAFDATAVFVLLDAARFVGVLALPVECASRRESMASRCDQRRKCGRGREKCLRFALGAGFALGAEALDDAERDASLLALCASMDNGAATRRAVRIGNLNIVTMPALRGLAATGNTRQLMYGARIVDVAGAVARGLVRATRRRAELSPPITGS